MKELLQNFIDKHAAVSPGKTAVQGESGRITYGSLKLFSDDVAKTLVGSKGSVVCLAMEASIHYVASLLGCLKAGAVALPAGTNLPPMRIGQMLLEAHCELIITSDKNLEKVIDVLAIPGLDHIQVISINDRNELTLSHAYKSDNKATVTVYDEDAFYLLFTSGSTGKPKSILGRHSSLMHFITWEIETFNISKSVRVSQFAPVTFDVSLRDIFVPLVTGGTLYLPESNLYNFDALCRWLTCNEITLIHCVPSLFRQLVETLDEPREGETRLKHLNHVFLAGEKIYGNDVLDWERKVGRHVELINLYGPTETTLAKAFYRIDFDRAKNQIVVPIGGPITNTRLYIIGDDGRPTTSGRGEIAIATDYGTFGYFRNDELNQQSFVANIIPGKPSEIVFLTGDIGQYLEDGSVAIYGRKDSQVKVNGIRIELGELENVLRTCDGISQAVVNAETGANHSISIVCFYKCHSLGALTGDDVRSYLERYIPANSLPHRYIEISEFKLNSNGKIDRSSLKSVFDSQPSGEKAADAFEVTILNVWKELIGMEKIPIDVSFFQVGGNSLLAIKLASRLSREFNRSISLQTILKNNTVRSLSRAIQEQQNPKNILVTPVNRLPRRSRYELSQQQLGIWLLLQHSKKSGTSFNEPMMFRIAPGIDAAMIESALEIVVSRHEALRTSFAVDQGAPYQTISDNTEVNVSTQAFPDVAFGSIEYTSIIEHLISDEMELSRAPLYRCSLLKFRGDEVYLLFVIHHIIFDQISAILVATEFELLLSTLLTGKEENLPPVRIHYKEFAVFQKTLLASPYGTQMRDYWGSKLSSMPKALELPADYWRPDQKSFKGYSIERRVSDVGWEHLLALQHQSGQSLFGVLTTTFFILFHKLSGLERFTVGTAMAGRQHPDFADTVGLFSNVLPLTVQIQGDSKVGALVQQTALQLIDVIGHQLYPFTNLIEDNKSERDFSRNPFFDICLNYIDGTRGDGDSAGLLSYVRCPSVSAKFDITFNITANRNHIVVDAYYAVDLYKAATVEYFLDAFEQVCQQLEANNKVEQIAITPSPVAEMAPSLSFDFGTNPDKI